MARGLGAVRPILMKVLLKCYEYEILCYINKLVTNLIKLFIRRDEKEYHHDTPPTRLASPKF